MSEFAEDKAKKINKRNWVSLVPYGLNEQHPNNYRDIVDAVWENRDNLSYAMRILRDGCCDGCSLGTSGMHDWTMKGIHLCAVRLQLFHHERAQKAGASGYAYTTILPERIGVHKPSRFEM